MAINGVSERRKINLMIIESDHKDRLRFYCVYRFPFRRISIIFPPTRQLLGFHSGAFWNVV